jgi:hypothetical protein
MARCGDKRLDVKLRGIWSAPAPAAEDVKRSIGKEGGRSVLPLVLTRGFIDVFDVSPPVSGSTPHGAECPGNTSSAGSFGIGHGATGSLWQSQHFVLVSSSVLSFKPTFAKPDLLIIFRLEL